MRARSGRPFLLILAIAVPLAAGAAVRTVQDQCGPFTDVSAMLCPYVLEAYYTGITAGTSATTFSPDVPITRGQAAVFTTKALDQALARSSRRAALGQWWTTQNSAVAGYTGGFVYPVGVQADGADIWVADQTGTVSRVRASDGRLIESWTVAAADLGELTVAAGKIFITGGEGQPNSGSVYSLDPQQPPGPLTPTYSVGELPGAVAFDGARLWTANDSGSFSIIDLATGTVTTVTNAIPHPKGLIFDGQNMWATDDAQTSIEKLDANGAVLQTVQIGGIGGYPVFDGKNLWVPARTSVQVVAASTGQIIATLTNPNMDAASSAAFDGQRVLVTNSSSSNNRIFLWNATSLAPINEISFGTLNTPILACSDGVNFWVTQQTGSNGGFLMRL